MKTKTDWTNIFGMTVVMAIVILILYGTYAFAIGVLK